MTGRPKGAAGPVRIRINNVLREHGYHHGRIRLLNQPAAFAIESTNRCNLRCVMCPRGEPDVMTRELGTMSDEVFTKVLDQARFYTDPCWFHWFGEPLLHPRLFDQIEMAKSRGVPNLGISTNGTLLDDRRATALLESPLDTLMIAIDGTTKDVYERIRISSQYEFEEVVENARSFLAQKRALSKSKPHTILSIIVMDETQAQLDEFQTFWEQAGADEILFKPFGGWGNQFDGLSILVEETKRVLQPREFPCKFLWESMVISWSGLVVPCCYDYDAKEVLGDVNHQTLNEIWNGEAYQRLRRNELGGCNDSSLCVNCEEAPGHKPQRLWPVRR